MFFGREGQIDQLESLWHKRVGSLVTCRGRRRIGKSTLIEQFAKKTASRFIKIEGVKPKPKFANENELEAFAMQLAAQTGADPTAISTQLFRLPSCLDFEQDFRNRKSNKGDGNA